MKTSVNQRWRESRSAYRPIGETINTLDYEVAAISDDSTAKQFVISHHYSRSYPAARFRFGLYKHGYLVGVAVFSHPTHSRSVTNVFPVMSTEAVELGRFVLLDQVPGNGETWFLGRAFHLLRQIGLLGVVSFSDDQPRTSDTGETVFLGHIGTIYQAHNARYLGRGSSRPLRLLPDGSVFHARMIQKIRAGERGWQSGVEKLMHYGADAPGRDRALWLKYWLSRLTRNIQHPGNHKYAWSLQPKKAWFLLPGMSYPKLSDQSEGREWRTRLS